MISIPMRPTLLHLILPFLLLITPAHAQRMEITLKGDVVTMKGLVDFETCDLLWFMLRRVPTVKTIALSSRGGPMQAGRCVGAMLRDLKLSTIILDSCMVGCVPIFMGGVERMIDNPKSVLLTQASFFLGERHTEIDPDQQRIDREWYPLMAPQIDRKLLEQWTGLKHRFEFMRFYQDKAEICEHKKCNALPGVTLKSAGLTTK
jgi:hypothetical protein